MQANLKTTKIIHIALITGVTLVYFLIGDLGNLNISKMPNIESSSFVFLLIPIGAILVGHMLYKQQLQRVDNNLDWNEKVAPYQTALLVRWALLEGAALVILFLKPDLMVIGFCLILYMAFLSPSKSGMERDFKTYGK